MPRPPFPYDRSTKVAALVATSDLFAYEIAAKAGVSPQTLGGVASGRINPTPAQRHRIADALGVTEDELFS